MKFLTSVILVVLVSLLNLTPAKAYDLFNPNSCGTSTNVCVCNNGSKTVTDSALCSDAKTRGDVNPTLHVIKITVNIIASIAGVAAVILIIVGGIGYITSGGNTETVNKSKSRISSALIGLIIIALAWTITSFVASRLIK